MIKMSAALQWLADHDPQDGGGQIGHTGADQLFTRQVVLDAFEAGAAQSAKPVAQSAAAAQTGAAADIAEVVALAQRDIARTQTDFIGRMAACMMDYENFFSEFPDGDLPEDAQQEADEAISGLAGLALAQLIMLRGHDVDMLYFFPRKQAATLLAALEPVIGKATDSDLTDGGRYFSETCTDLTRCRHGETGEYLESADGELVELLWNNRGLILTALGIIGGAAR